MVSGILSADFSTRVSLGADPPFGSWVLASLISELDSNQTDRVLCKLRSLHATRSQERVQLESLSSKSFAPISRSSA